MERVLVKGGECLSGEVHIGGSKNAALPLLFAGILTGERCVFSNLPRVSDVLHALEILRSMGARICFFANQDVSVDYGSVRSMPPPLSLTSSIRGSTYLMGAMLGRFGEARFAKAGGCDFGTRPIDQHLAGFARLGAVIKEEEGSLYIHAQGGLKGASVTLAMPSVGATANLLLAAATAQGETVIHNAAAEPHVAALAEFLTSAGASVHGIGTSTVRVVGVPRLHGVNHRIIPDMIEAGTYLCMGVACGGEVRVADVTPAHLGALLDVFRTMGVGVEVGEDTITVKAPGHYFNTVVQTGPYPGFPTDLHPQLTALFCIGGRARGVGIVRECIWQNRFRYVSGLQSMGASIAISGDSATVLPARLHAASICSPDLRGGAALLLAALAASGESEIRNAATIARGYDHLEEKLLGLGAHVKVD